MKKGKTDSGMCEVIAAAYNKLQEASATAMNRDRDRDEQDSLATGGSGEKEVRKVKG